MRRSLPCALLLAACGADAAALPVADAGADATFDDAPYFAFDASDEWSLFPPAPPPGGPPPLDAGDPPDIACGPDAGPDAGSCDRPPPSECASSSWLVYYVDGVCIDGRCSWTKRFLACGCRHGACCPPSTPPCL